MVKSLVGKNAELSIIYHNTINFQGMAAVTTGTDEDVSLFLSLSKPQFSIWVEWLRLWLLGEDCGCFTLKLGDKILNLTIKQLIRLSTRQKSNNYELHITLGI